MRLALILSSILLLTGCVCLDPAHKRPLPPQVNTEKVIESLKQVKDELNNADQENENVSVKIDRALRLAERLDTLLEQIELLFAKDKVVLKPE